MKHFPLEPLSRVRDLRLDAARRAVAERRADVEKAEHRRDLARQARSTVVESRHRHQRACEVATSQPDLLAIDWLERAERHRLWIDSEIVRNDGVLAAAEKEVAQAVAKLNDELATLRRAQAKVDALQTFRGEWTQNLQRETERREERDSEELYRPPSAAMR